MSEIIQQTDHQHNSRINKEATSQFYQAVITFLGNRATAYGLLADLTTDEGKKASFVNEEMQYASYAELVRQEAERRGLTIAEP